MPRPPVYSARSRAVLSRSFASIPSPRGARSIRFNRASVFRPAWFSVLICPPIANPFVSNTCGLFFPLAALFCIRSLCFQQFADSFAKYPGGGGVRTVQGHRDGLLRWLFTGGSTGRWFKTGEQTNPRCRRRRLCPALEARHRAAAPARDLLPRPA
jgi:hypothetical protein